MDPSKPEKKQGNGVLQNVLLSKEEVLRDYHICCLSRELSATVRKEVLNGRAKFGSGGGGKELPQIAMARAFRKGDFLSPYYREQTFMLAKGLVNAEQYCSFLYGDAENEIFSGGRQMPNCYGTAFIDNNGLDINHLEHYNVASVIAPVAGHFGRALGLAIASEKYRRNPLIQEPNKYSQGGREVSFCTIGDASTSEGVFFETINAAGVLKVPLAVFIWDDGYGISVPTSYQTTKENISEVLEGFRANEEGDGIDIYTLKGWDYPNLVETIVKGIEKVRNTYIPAVFHVQECTQPFGHSTSGSHERYKSADRLEWEARMDGLRQMEAWILDQGLATGAELADIQAEARAIAEKGRQTAWKRYRHRVETEQKDLKAAYAQLMAQNKEAGEVKRIAKELDELINPALSHILNNARRMQFAVMEQKNEAVQLLRDWISGTEQTLARRYHTHLYSEHRQSALNVPVIAAQYDDDAPLLNGFEILNHFFDKALQNHPNLYAFGEDVGKIGDVNQAFAGLQARYGEDRVFDTGIREWTIASQAFGMAMRGLRPIGEIQYLDYLAYAFAPLTDDLATLRYRTNDQQMAPAIIRTRGHRLEGIWHSGSPIGMLLHSMRGIYLLVPRNMTQAAGLYNTMLQSDDPAILIECLNGYRLKERLPANIGTYTVPLGRPEILQEGTDITLVTYGSCVRVAQEGIQLLRAKGISVELIDVQTLLPFDLSHRILQSVKKTNRVLFMDEDVPGGASAFMMQQVVEEQGAYQYLDSPPTTLCAADHRPPFGDDGNYSSKPNANDVFITVYRLLQEAEPQRFTGLI